MPAPRPARAPDHGVVRQAVRVDDPAASFSTRSDAAGAFRLDSLVPGRYVLGFLHPLLDMLGVEVKALVVDLSTGVSGTVNLAVPGPASVRGAVCPATVPADSAGAVAGAVRDADTEPAGAPASGRT